MALTFLQQRKNQQYLILALISVLLITFFVLWQGFIKKETDLPSIEHEISFKKIDINYDKLKNPVLQELDLFEQIVPFEGEPGRENPFVPAQEELPVEE